MTISNTLLLHIYEKRDLSFLMDLEDIELSPGGRLKPPPITELKLCSGVGCNHMGCLKSFLYYTIIENRHDSNYIKYYQSIFPIYSCYYPFDDITENWIFKIYEPDKMTPEEYEKAEPVILEIYRWKKKS